MGPISEVMLCIVSIAVVFSVLIAMLVFFSYRKFDDRDFELLISKFSHVRICQSSDDKWEAYGWTARKELIRAEDDQLATSMKILYSRMMLAEASRENENKPPA